MVSVDTIKSSFHKFLTCVFSPKKIKLKHIEADDDVLETYHDSFLFGEFPLSIKLRTAFRTGYLGSVFKTVDFLASILSVVLYIKSTYAIDQGIVYIRIMEAISVFFIIDYILKIFCAYSTARYIFSFNGIVDLLTSIPLLFYLTQAIKFGQIFRISIFLRTIRPFTRLNSLAIIRNSISQQILLLFLYIISIIFVAAGLIQWVEFISVEKQQFLEEGCGESGCIRFFDAFYFVIETISTVGYGEITLQTSWGRLVAIILIITSIVILPSQINTIIDLASRSPYGGQFNIHKIIGSRYIILCGNVTYQTIMHFLYELYYALDEKDLAAYPLRVVILAPYRPSFDVKTLISKYDDLVEFIQGSPLSWRDLDRVNARSASAIFLFQKLDKVSENYENEDCVQIVQALSLNRYCGANVQIFAELDNPENDKNPIWDDTENAIQVICPDLIRFQILASGCFIKGFSTFLTNLFRSGIKLKHHDDPRQHINHHAYVDEYHEGNLYEIYPVILPKIFHGLQFEEVCEFIYLCFGLTLFALDSKTDDVSDDADDLNPTSDRHVYMFPKCHVINSSDIGLIFATDIVRAQQISAIDDHFFSDNDIFSMDSNRNLHPLHEHFKDCKKNKNLMHTMNDGDGDDGNDDGNDDKMFNFHSHSLFSMKTGNDTSLLRIFKTGEVNLSCRKVKGRIKKLIQSVHARWADDSPYNTLLLNSPEPTYAYLNATETRLTQNPTPGQPNPTQNQTQNQSQNQTQSQNQYQYQNQPVKKYERLSSIEGAMDRVLSWPPLEIKRRKLNPAIVWKNEEKIQSHLRHQTLNLVNMSTPHVLICMQHAWSKNLFQLIYHLRSSQFSSLPIVILHPWLPSMSAWGNVGIFDQVYFVKGSPLQEIDMIRAGLMHAFKVIILSPDGNKGKKVGVVDSENDAKTSDQCGDYLSDVDNATAVAIAEKFISVADHVLVEMQHELSFQFLKPMQPPAGAILSKRNLNLNNDIVYQLCPPYMAGFAFCSSVLSFLSYSSFYNRNTLKIVDQFLNGGPIKGKIEPNLDRRIFSQIKVPPECIGKDYAFVFSALLHKGVLCLGIYRDKESVGSPVPFVHTNPRATVQVNAQDLLFILH